LKGIAGYLALSSLNWVFIAWAMGCVLLVVLIVLFFAFQKQEQEHKLDFLRTRKYEFGVLICQSGHLEQDKYPVVRSGLTIGREPNTCDIIIQTSSISREHSRIFLMRDRPVLADLNSKNGTLVNGEFITQHELQNGDIIELGKKNPVTFVYKVM